MLNQAGFRLLSGLRERRDWKAVRLVVHLVAEYDLREFVIVSAPRLAAQLGRHRVSIRQALTRLVRVGFLEEGPRVLRMPTFRIRRALLLTTYELRRRTRQIRWQEEMSSIVPGPDS